MKKKQLSISDALFSKVKQQVLGLFYSQPDKDFHTNEIIRLTQIGTGAVQRELKKLTTAGLLTVKQIGNQKRYQANQNALLFTEIFNIIIKTFGLADILREALKPINEQIVFAFIYGSIARQEDTANSDIDLMIIGNNLTYGDFFQLFEKAETKLSRKINPTFYTPTDWKRKHKADNNFLCKVMQQPKIFLLGTENELEKFG